MVRSKCGMPPTTPTPRSSARSRLATPPVDAQHAVLGKGDELQVEVGRDAALHLEQRIDREAARIAGVDVAADREQALGHRPVAVGQGALDQRFGGEQRLQLAPEGDAFEQRAAGVDARQAVAERRVHVEVRVAERRRDEQPARRDRLVRRRREAGRDFDDAAVLDRDRHVLAPVGQRGIGNQEVEHATGLSVI